MDKETKKNIKSTPDWNALYSIIKELDYTSLNTREIELVNRQIEKTRANADLKVAYLSNHTIDTLAPYVSVISAMHGVNVESYIAPYDQYFQELLSETSGTILFQPDIIHLDLSVRGLAPLICEKFLSLDDALKLAEQERIISLISQLANLAIKQTNAYLLVSNFLQPAYPQGGIADLKQQQSETEWYSRLNLALIGSLRNNNRVFLVDKNNVLARVGKENVTDSKMLYLAKMELNDVGLQALASELNRYIIAIAGKTKKNLVLDLDNTLWGGVIGEDGVDGIKIGKGYPEGEIYYALQTYIKNLKQRGIILTLASKNNLEDVEEAFEKRTEMPLGLSDFATKRINWDPKHTNLVSMAKGLSIGIDSFVFLDDNPVERALVKSTLKEVVVPDLPKDPSTYLNILMRSPYFEKLFLTEEDAHKTEQYAANAQREDTREEIGDMSTFLSSLGTKVTIEIAKKENIQRVHQLFSKTNQFNVTTKRHGVPEIENFIENESFDLFSISVTDNFGDLGMIGVVLVEIKDDIAYIDSFIMSCRAMGRAIETVIMNVIKEKYLPAAYARQLVAEYIPTAKNVPVKSFFDDQGFDLVEKGDNGRMRYELKSKAKGAESLECIGIEIYVGE